MVIAYIIAVISFVLGIVFVLGAASATDRCDTEASDVLSVAAGLSWIIFIITFVILGTYVFNFNKLHLDKLHLIITNVEELKDKDGEVHHIVWVDKHDNKFMYTREEDDIRPRKEDEIDE